MQRQPRLISRCGRSRRGISLTVQAHSPLRVLRYLHHHHHHRHRLDP